MPSLKDLRVRIKSVKSTQKITSAMKMVAAAKLRRAQAQAESARPYSERMSRLLRALAAAYEGRPGAPPLLTGTGKDAVRLVIVVTSDRGLCGGFNSSVVRDAKRLIRELIGQGKTVKILCIGRKGRDQLKREHGGRILDTIEDMARPRLTFAKAEAVAARLAAMFEAHEFDAATVVFNRFKSVISQIVTRQRLIPLPPPEAESEPRAGTARAVYEYEPGEDELLAELLTRNLGVQIFRALLESWASEQGARMTAMDNATRNAGDMIDRITLFYNRTRQASITRELIEIISGAEAL
jgi:F-type H+-transporting ATPase subunit gamma